MRHITPLLHILIFYSDADFGSWIFYAFVTAIIKSNIYQCPNCKWKCKKLSKGESNYYHIQVGTCIRSLKHVAGNRLIWSDLFQEIQWNLGASNRTEGKEEEEGKEDNSVRFKSILKIFLHWSFVVFNNRRAAVRPRTLFIVTKLPKLGNLELGSFWLLVKVLHNVDCLIILCVCVYITSPLGSSGSFQWDHAELLLKAHCLVIFWSVIHKTYMRIRCNAINVALSVKFSKVDNLYQWCDDSNCRRHWCIWKILTFMNSFWFLFFISSPSIRSKEWVEIKSYQARLIACIKHYFQI